jgi:3-methyladenine DNA glycosylase AlkC
MEHRKGARRRDEVTAEVLRGLNGGTLQTASLPEALVVDFAALMKAALPRVRRGQLERLDPAMGIVRRMQVAGEILFEHAGEEAEKRFGSHPSDTVRGWAAYALANVPGLSIPERVRRVRPFADDHHFGVREWAWIAVRPNLAEDVGLAVEALLPWTADDSVNVRRFAVEVLRPRGVWCSHIAALKESPERGLPLLTPCRADSSRYVQNSVANWLNDASRSRPDWVRAVCAKWGKGRVAKETAYILRRALRTLDGGEE